MKVLHVIPAVAPCYGGPSRTIFEMCRAIQDKGLELLIVTTDADGRNRLSVELEKPLAYEDVPTIFFSRQLSESFKYSGTLAHWLNENVKNFDVVHIHAIFSHTSLAAANACRKYDKPYVLRPLGSLDPWGLSQKRMRKRLLWNFGVKQMLNGAAAIHYTTNTEQRHAENTFGLNNGVVIPLGIEEEMMAAPTASEDFRKRYASLRNNPYVLALSRIHPVKALEILLENFLDVTRKRRFHNWRLVIAGDGKTEYVDSLKSLVREHEGNGRVIFTGWLDGTEKVSVLKGAALLALPSYQENFGLSVVEAMACGVPVFVSEHVNLAEEIQDVGAGWVVPLKRADLSRALETALKNKKDRISRGAAGRKLVHSRFTWKTVSKQLVELYRSVIRKK